MDKATNREPARGYADRKEMRNFVLRHLYLVTSVSQDILVLRYGLISGRNVMGWSEVSRLSGRTERIARYLHDTALKTILRYTNDKSIPLIAQAPFGEIEEMKLKARTATVRAINSGKVLRQPCERCGSNDSEAHHPNYLHPLNVMWLCKQHHTEEHSRRGMAARARGETWD